MPAHINYETTPIIFYKFVCENPEIKSCYVGHTSNFQQRKSKHKYCCNTEKSLKYNLKIYQIIRENGGWEKWKMVEIDRQICLDETDACKIEQKYIEELQADMNSKFANRTSKQYYLDTKNQNKEKKIECQKNYYLKNKKKLYIKQSQKFNCECGGKCNIYSKIRHFNSKKHTDYLATIINNIDIIQNDTPN